MDFQSSIEGIISLVFSVSALTWYIRYICYLDLQFLNNVIIIKSKVLPLHWLQAQVTLDDFGDRGLLAPKFFLKLFGFPLATTHMHAYGKYMYLLFSHIHVPLVQSNTCTSCSVKYMYLFRCTQFSEPSLDVSSSANPLQM